jgi:hypothetical protein
MLSYSCLSSKCFSPVVSAYSFCEEYPSHLHRRFSLESIEYRSVGTMGFSIQLLLLEREDWIQLAHNRNQSLAVVNTIVDRQRSVKF